MRSFRSLYVLVGLIIPIVSWGKGGVTAISTSNSPATPLTYTVGADTYNWGRGSDVSLDSFDFSGETYTYVSEANSIVIRRVDNINSSGVPCSLFAAQDTTGTTRDVLPSYPRLGATDNCDITAIMGGRIINRGVLDLFNNVDSPAPKNIERVDFIFTGGIQTPVDTADLTKAGFVVTEKSGNNDIIIAAILSVDGSGNPTSYSPAVRVFPVVDSTATRYAYGIATTGIENTFFAGPANPPHSYVTEDETIAEALGMVFVDLEAFGVGTNQTIFGFSYFSGDVAETATNALGQVNWSVGIDPLVVAGFPQTTSRAFPEGDADVYGGTSGYFAASTLAELTGTVFHDQNVNQLNDAGDTGMNNIAVNLYLDSGTLGVLDGADTLIATQDSDVNGDYQFIGVAAESYLVQVVVADPDVTAGYGFEGTNNPIAIKVSASVDINGLDFPFAFLTAPTAVADIQSNPNPISPTNPTVVDVLNNDTDPENNIDPTSVVIVNPPVGSVLTPNGKTLVLSGEGQWDVDLVTGDITYTPLAGFTTDPTPIEYTMADTTGQVSNTVTVTVVYGNAPVALNDTVASPNPISPTNPVSVDVLGNDTDPENNIDPATVVIVNPLAGSTLSPSGKTLTVPGEGQWITDPVTGVITFTPEVGFTANPTPIQYTVTDTTNLVSNIAIVTVTYATAPIAVDDTRTNPNPISPTNPTVVVVVANDIDPNNDIDTTTVVITNPPAGSTLSPSGKTLTVPGEGQWVVDLVTGEITFTPEAGVTSNPTPIEYTVTDSTSRTSNTAVVTVIYGNAPIAVDDFQPNPNPISPTNPTVVDVLANDTDPENNIDATTVVIVNPPAGSSLSPTGKTLTVPGEGLWDVNPLTGEITFTPVSGFTANPTPIEYTVTDTTSLVSFPATVTVAYVPIALDDTQSNPNPISPTNPTVVDVLANDTDPGNNIDPTTVVIVNPPAGSTLIPSGKSLTVPGEGVWVVDPVTGAITFTPEAGFTGNPTPIEYTVNNTTGQTSNPGLVTIVYGGAPIAVDDLQTNANPISPTNPTVVDVVVNDTDPENNLDVTTVVIINPPAGATLNPTGKTLVVPGEGIWDVNLVTGAITFTPAAGFLSNPTPIQYTVTDTTGLVSNPGTVTVIYPASATTIVLNKEVNKQEALIGDLLQYTIRAESQLSSSIPQVNVSDNIPTGFSYVPDSAQIIRAGADNILNTNDDITSVITVTGTDPILFTNISFAPQEILQIRYFLRVGTGVTEGQYTNFAIANFPGAVGASASNETSATVIVVQDPILQKTTVIGKVFHDRDGDGIQNNANATGLVLSSSQMSEILSLEDLPGRVRESDPIEEHQHKITLGAEINEVMISSNEGSVFTVLQSGDVTTQHIGKKKSGFTSQDLHIEVLYEQEEWKVIISNHGINEEGLPGVRLATVGGLVIETDQFGRYHIADVDTGKSSRGINYIVKVDSASLPPESVFTTENPRVLRMTPGLMTRFNFGVSFPEAVPVVTVPGEEVEMLVTETGVETISSQVDTIHFSSGKSFITKQYLKELRQKIASLDDKSGVRVNVYGHTDSQSMSVPTAAIYTDNQGLSEARSRKVADRIANYLDINIDQIAMAGFAERQPAASNDTPEGMAQNRRAEIEITYEEPYSREVNKLVQGADRQINLPHGGVIWLTEDPSRTDPRLNILAADPLVIDAGMIVRPVKFHVYSNYSAFINNYELLIYSDDDKFMLKPIARFEGEQLDLEEGLIWDGEVSTDIMLKPGHHLTYVLKVHDGEGHTDSTRPQVLHVIDTRELTDMNESDPQQIAAQLLGTSNMEKQTIPVQGSVVRIQGSDIDQNYVLTINNQRVLIGGNNQFVLEENLPVGIHSFDVSVDAGNQISWQKTMDVDVTGEYLFLVGLADLYIGDNSVSGNVEALASDEHFDETVFLDGRLAFYLKGKVKGKYLITAQLDSTEDQLKNMGSNLQRKDPKAIFRRLDPDQFYPVYGDDSTTRSDVDSQGAFYVRVDWDKSKVLWGNYNTQFTGNELAQYNRSLYGAQLIHKDLRVTSHGDARTEVIAFASEAQTAQGHNEFPATGGSLYYLREIDLVRGSEKVWVETRERDTRRVVNTQVLKEGQDYEIDHLQGRIILSRPLSQVVSLDSSSIIKDRPLEGDDVILIVDYEFVPQSFSGDDIAAGVRGKGWVTDGIALGGTYTRENRETGSDYELKGIDITLKKDQGTWLKTEIAESESSHANSWFSTDGGLSFTDRRLTGVGRKGRAYHMQGRLDFSSLGTDAVKGNIEAWWKDRDAGYSSTRVNDGIETKDFGAKFEWLPSQHFRLTGKASQLEQAANKQRIYELQGRYETTDKLSLIGEVRHLKSDNIDSRLGFTGDGKATIAALGVEYALGLHTQLYGNSQFVLGETNYRDNESVTLGVKSQLNDKLALKTEATAGDRGNAIIAGVDYQLTKKINLQIESGFGSGATSQIGTNYTTADGSQYYGSYSIDPDRTDNDQRVLTLGQRKKYSDALTMFSEYQFTESDDASGIAKVFGIEHQFSDEIALSAGHQHAKLKQESGDVERDTASLALRYKKQDLKANSRLEYRRDRGVTDLDQWLTSNAIDWRQSIDMRWLFKLNLALSKNKQSNLRDGYFTEMDLGFAYRPAFSDRLNILGKYSFLYDLPAALSTGNLVGQNSSDTDQRAHVLSVDTLFDLNKSWELGGKIALRKGETRLGRDTGAWLDSGARFATLRTRYHIVDKWDGVAAYQWLQAETQDDVRHGLLLEIDRHLGDNMKMGIGYNFTRFDDDLKNLDYEAGGWFLNIIGKY